MTTEATKTPSQNGKAQPAPSPTPAPIGETAEEKAAKIIELKAIAFDLIEEAGMHRTRAEMLTAQYSQLRQQINQMEKENQANA